MSKNTENTFLFQIEGESFSSPKKVLTAKEIIEYAKEKGLSASKPPIEDLVLKGQKNTYAGDDKVDLSEDNDFTLGVKAYKFKVNGQELESKFEKLVALDIIEIAEKNGVLLPGKYENLLLETVGEKPHSFKLDEWVDLEQFYEFLLILNEPTPVA